jgi:hypothetical protein
MVELNLGVLQCFQLEAIVVELADERNDVFGSEILWEYDVGKCIFVIDDDGEAVVSPADVVSKQRVLVLCILLSCL